jgi:hypothetical protein
MTSSDVGPGFVRDSIPGGDASNTASPCLSPGSPSLNAKYPPAARARTGFRSSAPQALLEEQVTLYRDDRIAAAVIAYAQKALGCKSATVQGQTVHIRPSAPTRQVHGEAVDSAQTWNLTIGPAAASIVAVRLGNTVVSMEFVALSSSDVRKLPKQDAVVAAAVTRAKAALS